MTSKADADTTLDFETSLQTLEKLVETIEDGQLSLDESLRVFEQGIALTKQCQDKLAAAEQRIQILTASNTLEALDND